MRFGRILRVNSNKETRERSRPPHGQLNEREGEEALSLLRAPSAPLWFLILRALAVLS
jgi:hypothetical protein